MNIIAHRGASYYAPENSLSAFQLALEHAVSGIEFDVHYCHGQALVIHDVDLQRTHNHPAHISTLTPKQLSEYQIPTLEQVVTLIGTECIINIEVKSVDDNTGFIQHLLDLQTRKLIHSNTVISSFNHCLLDQYQVAGVNTQYAGLIAHLPKDLAQFAVTGGFDIIAIAADVVNQAMIINAHHLGKKVWVYTVDDPAKAAHLRLWQVDAIFSNDTLKMQQS